MYIYIYTIYTVYSSSYTSVYIALIGIFATAILLYIHIYKETQYHTIYNTPKLETTHIFIRSRMETLWNIHTMVSYKS